MGDIADMMINGDMDCETGEWLGEGDGFPRTARGPCHEQEKQRPNTTKKLMCKCGRVRIQIGQRKKTCHLCRKEAHEKLNGSPEDSGNAFSDRLDYKIDSEPHDIDEGGF